MPKISVVMPSLNVAGFIVPCIESVIGQTLEDMEILVVDAGSTDGTLEILRKYQEKDERIQIICSDKRSYGYQMNIGIRQASGEYIGIVETDDFIEKDMFEALYRCALENRSDYVKGMAQRFYDGVNGAKWRYKIIPYLGLTDLDQAETVPCEHPELFWSDNFLWNGIYRADFLKQIKFSETSGAAFQDIGALFQIISSAKSAVYVNKKVYNYRRDNADASSYNKKSFQFAAAEYKNMERFLKNLGPEWEHSYYKKMMELCLNRFDFMSATENYWEESQEGIDWLRERIKWAFDHHILTEEDVLEADKPRIKILFEDPHALFEYDRSIYYERRSLLEAVYEKCKDQKVIIFGAGSLGNFIHQYLLTRGAADIAAYCDNDGDKQGGNYQNLPVISPKQAVLNYPDACYVIANKRHGDEIKKQLLDLGIPEENMCFYNARQDIFLLMK